MYDRGRLKRDETRRGGVKAKESAHGRLGFDSSFVLPLYVFNPASFGELYRYVQFQEATLRASGSAKDAVKRFQTARMARRPVARVLVVKPDFSGQLHGRDLMATRVSSGAGSSSLVTFRAHERVCRSKISCSRRFARMDTPIMASEHANSLHYSGAWCYRCLRDPRLFATDPKSMLVFTRNRN